MIRVRGLHKRFGAVHAVRGIDLDVSPGEVVVVIGPSGCGKSTLLRCLNGLERPTQGSIHIDDVDISSRSTDIDRVRTEVGMVFQQFNLFPHLTVGGNVSLAQRKVLRRDKDETER